MIVQKPKQIDFAKLKKDVEDLIVNLNEVCLIIKENIEAINSKPDKTIEEKLNIQEMAREYNELIIDIQVKQTALDEYNQRCKEMEDLEIQQHNDFLANYDTVFAKAKIFANETRLPKDLNTHLCTVLNVNTLNFDRRQKIDYYMALKTEVGMCETWLNNLILKTK